ncbi:MAG: hypothetical protein FWG21_06530 [Oscillospiraceae bacterium]|nr:hypothetical protein [Oscillospiraceae bacterium]
MKKIKCPSCGSYEIAKILYGLPYFNDDLKKKLEAKEIVLGGCIVYEGNPEFYCNSCEISFKYSTLA